MCVLIKRGQVSSEGGRSRENGAGNSDITPPGKCHERRTERHDGKAVLYLEKHKLLTSSKKV